MTSYCDISKGHPWHGPYHDQVHGFPTTQEPVLFERLALEINQAGLSWLTVLKKRAAFQEAFNGFNVDQVATYDDYHRTRLLSNPQIIRNRRKINAVIANAQIIMALRHSHESFANWLKIHHPRSKEEWVILFRRTFHFVGPEIVNEFLMSIGYLPGAHQIDCQVYQRILVLNPPWYGSHPHAQQ